MNPRFTLISVFALLVFTGCTTSLTNMAPARTFKPGEAQVAAGYQLDVHTQTFTGIKKAGEAVVDEVKGTPEGETISEESLRTLLDAALLLKMFPPGGGPEIMGRVGLYDGVLEGIDAGFRFNGNVYKGDVRLQVWASPDDAQALSVQFAYGHHKSVASSWMEWITLTEWKRRDLDFQLNYGYEISHLAKLYVAPRYINARISTEAKLSDYLKERLPQRVQDYDPSTYFPPSSMHYIGLNWGAMVGYRYAFLNVDVSTFRLLFTPSVLGSERDYKGWVFSPTLGLTLMWR